MMPPDEMEAHAKSAKRQFDALGINTDIDPEEYRDIAAEHAVMMSESATRGDIESLKSEIKELRRLIVSLSSSKPIVNVSYSGVSDAISRSTYQVSKALRATTY